MTGHIMYSSSIHSLPIKKTNYQMPKILCIDNYKERFNLINTAISKTNHLIQFDYLGSIFKDNHDYIKPDPCPLILLHGGKSQDKEKADDDKNIHDFVQVTITKMEDIQFLIYSGGKNLPTEWEDCLSKNERLWYWPKPFSPADTQHASYVFGNYFEGFLKELEEKGFADLESLILGK